ncbi:hypothetical protein [Spelaeicoccus albus]|uniref:Uncharacterized protein n=1 Tax=Spelaeicoccus albus TaxID=1280376 RepID=A0A7Z0ABM8_9MICO|nr:hypothetical protein [Spelaeicoccus albus]NYI67155.1 hypothetical protein [Spelaeicoccus albus]
MNEEQAAARNSVDQGGDETPVDPQAALGIVNSVQERSRRATSWLGTFFLLYGIGIALVGISIGASGGRFTTAAMVLWVVFVVVTVMWANLKRAVIKGMGSLMAIWAICFCATWVPTVTIGATVFPHRVSWWIWCGIGTIIVHLVLAVWVWRKSARR